MQRRSPACLIVLALLATAQASAEDPPQLLRVGLVTDATRGSDIPAVHGTPGGGPLVRLAVDWQDVEQSPGVYDWSVPARAIEARHAAGYGVVLALFGSNALHGGAPSPLVPGSLDAWLGFVRSAVTEFVGRVEVYELGESVGVEGEFEPDLRALVLKQSALAVRAQARTEGISVRIAQAALEAGALDRQEALWERDLAAYVDILPVWSDPRRETAATELRAVLEARLRHPPAAAPWVYVASGEGWDAAGLLVTALAEGAEAALVQDSREGPLAEALPGWLTGLQQLLDRGFLQAPTGALRLTYGPQPLPEGAAVLGRFFNEQDSTTLVVYRAPEPPAGGVGPALIVDAPTVKNVRVVDLESGSSAPVFSTTPAEGGLALRVGSGEAPRAALFERQLGAPGLELTGEEVDVASERGLTAEEIIARYQEVQGLEDLHLERWIARGRVDFHFRLAEGGQSVVVSVESNYLWERGQDLEWEQTDYFFNGNRINWKSIPQLPLIQPEKVVTLPLDLTLNKTYGYRLVGRERVGPRQAYVLEFQPVAADASLSLYRGRIWIDTETFVRLKTSLVQNNMTPPVLSNEEVDRYEAQSDANGRTYHLFSHIEGQQVWSVLGRTFVVERELTFEDYRVNLPAEEFEERRRQAYASNNQMLRDTDSGFRYLSRQPDGSRVLTDAVKTSHFLAGGGAFKDGSLDNVLPVGAVDYFDYEVGQSKVQLNLFFAGPFGTVTATKPELFGRPLDLTVDLAVAGITFDDKFYQAGQERIEERVETLSEFLRVRLGIPAGKFVKFTLIGGLEYTGYAESDDAQDALAAFNAVSPGTSLEFIVPADHLVTSVTLDGQFNRRGYTVDLSGGWARRSDWEPWGLHDSIGLSFGHIVNGSFAPGSPEPLDESYAHWGARIYKEWYLPKFQKLRGEIDFLDGSRLDRFSRYQFSYFGEDRLNGFSGSGVRFDRGVVARAGYAFNLFEVIQLGATIESARVEERTSSLGPQSFTGLGLSGNIVGPWKTVLAAGYGRALASDIPELEGDQEFLFLVLKLF